MTSVFERHKEELESFEKLFSRKTGRLVFAMWILSDICETLSILDLKGTGKAVLEILTELNEARELLHSLIEEELKEKWEALD